METVETAMPWARGVCPYLIDQTRFHSEKEITLFVTFLAIIKDIRSMKSCLGLRCCSIMCVCVCLCVRGVCVCVCVCIIERGVLAHVYLRSNVV